MAVRKKWKTMIMRVKEVITIRIAGAKVRMVKRAIICNATATSRGEEASAAPNVTEGIGKVGGCCCARAAPVRIIKRVIIKIPIFFGVLIAFPPIRR
jgi:hypothetical protein